MVVLTVVTFGVYYPLWFLRRRAALNQLNSPKKLAAWPFILLLVFLVSQIVLALASDPAAPQDQVSTGGLIFRLMRLAIGLLIVVQCFFIKDILEDHLSGHEALPLSPIMTFFFQAFYLQHVINRHVAASVR